MFKDLNDQQKEAVFELGSVLLTACPGSGKTRTLIYKIAYELEKTIDSKKIIIAVTFTNRAADEIKKRINYFNIDNSNLWTGTIHSFCLKWILRPYMCYLEDTKNGFSIADSYESENIISDLKKKYNLKSWDDINTRYQLNGDIEELVHRDLVDEYHNVLKGKKLIDFDQILYYSYKLISTYPKISATLKNLFHIICVDEYQDTQLLQYGIFSQIIRASSGNCKMFMVGDADQAIFGSLGGVAKSLQEIELDFQTSFKNLELSGNYRSNQKIIDYYSNFQTSGINIEAVGINAYESAVITYNRIVNKENLVEYIASIITKKLTDGIPENEICVLAPTWYLVIPMGRKLRAKLPDVKFDAIGLSPLQKNKENVWFKIARLFLVAPSPETFVTRKRWASQLINDLEYYNVILFENEEHKSKKLLKYINSISSTEDDGLLYLYDSFQQLFHKLEIDISLNEHLLLHWDSFFAGAEKRLNDKLFDMARDIDSFRRMFKHDEGVVIETCHGIKGEEFDTVIVFGLLERLVPNWRETDIIAGSKLLYVVCSRAKSELHLISELGRMRFNNIPYSPTKQLAAIAYEYDNL